MEVGVSIGRAVRCNQQFGPIKVGGVDRNQFDLHRPLGKLRPQHRHVLPCRFRLMLHLAHLAAGAAVVHLRHRLVEHAAGRAAGAAAQRLLGGCGFLALVFLHSLFIISGGFALHKGDSAGGAMGQAVAEAIAVVIPHQFGLTVDHGDSTFVAGIGAGTAAVAFIGIDLDNFANHRGCSFLRAVQCRALLCGALLFSFCCACIIMPSGQ